MKTNEKYFINDLFDEVKKNADFTTTSVDEDGIMNALIKYGVIS